MLYKLKLIIHKYLWKKANKYNFTSPVNIFCRKRVSVGNNTYGFLNVLENGQGNLKIGSFCSIAPNVAFILNADHYINHISSYPFKAMFLKQDEAISKGDIIVGDDVWIGYGATILSGITIGQGAIIAAGALVSKDVEPYSLVGGVPAKLIRYRFKKELIDELLKIDFTRLSKKDALKNIDALYCELNDTEQIDWLPKKHQT